MDQDIRALPWAQDDKVDSGATDPHDVRHHETRPGEPDPVLLCVGRGPVATEVFEHWRSRLRPVVQVVPVELPTSPAAEAASLAMEESVTSICSHLEAMPPRAYAVFGHGAGAIVGYEAVSALCAGGGQRPLWFFASGCVAPRHAAQHAGCPAPCECGDSALSSYRWRPRLPMRCPVTAFSGSEDHVVPARHVQSWATTTSASFLHRQVRGGHGFLGSSHGAAAVVDRLERDLVQALVPDEVSAALV